MLTLKQKGSSILVYSKQLYSINSRLKLRQYSQNAWRRLYQFNYFICIKNINLLANNYSTSTWHIESVCPILSQIKNDYTSSCFTNRKCNYHNSPHNIDFKQSVPRTTEESEEILKQDPVSPPNPKILKVAIIGTPNSGKSTLTNKLIGWKICNVSQKVHTTQCNAQAVCNRESTQLVFLDTPGIVSPDEVQKYRLKHSLVIDPELSLQQADLIAVIHDAANAYTRHALNPRILRLLTLYPSIPSILLLNKVDRVKTRPLLLPLIKKLTAGSMEDGPIGYTSSGRDDNEQHHQEHLRMAEENKLKMKFHLSHSGENSTPDLEPIRNPSKASATETGEEASEPLEEEESRLENLSLDEVVRGNLKLTESQVQEAIGDMKGWPYFKEIFIISALNGEGIEDVSEYFFNNAKEGHWVFNDDVITDQSPQDLALMTVREKCLEYLPHNLPYELKFQLVYWDLASELLNIVVGISFRKKNYHKRLLGHKGKKVKEIVQEAQQSLRDTFRTEVRLRINIQHDPDLGKA